MKPANGRIPKMDAAHAVALAAWIEAQSVAGEPATLAALAGRTGRSRFQVQRGFQAALGVTPRQFAEACRLRRFKRELRAGGTVTAAIYAAGFGGPSRVYERLDRRLGMTPGQYQRRGQGLEISYARVPSPLGTMLLAATDRGLCGLQFGRHLAQLVARLQWEFPRAALRPMAAPPPAPFRAWVQALAAFWRQENAPPRIPIAARATAFQAQVWRFLQTIPPGQSRSYAQVAAGIGRPAAARAVARACAGNPVAVLIPCHRVIRGDGGLGGYRWGAAIKRQLLAREARRAARP